MIFFLFNTFCVSAFQMEKCEVSSPSKPLRPLLSALAVALFLCQISGTFSAAAAGGGRLRDLDAQELLNGEFNHICTYNAACV